MRQRQTYGQLISGRNTLGTHATFAACVACACPSMVDPATTGAPTAFTQSGKCSFRSYATEFDFVSPPTRPTAVPWIPYLYRLYSD